MWIELHSKGKPSLVNLDKINLIKPNAKKPSVTNIIYNGGEAITVDENYEQIKKLLPLKKAGKA